MAGTRSRHQKAAARYEAVGRSQIAGLARNSTSSSELGPVQGRLVDGAEVHHAARAELLELRRPRVVPGEVGGGRQHDGDGAGVAQGGPVGPAERLLDVLLGAHGLGPGVVVHRQPHERGCGHDPHVALGPVDGPGAPHELPARHGLQERHGVELGDGLVHLHQELGGAGVPGGEVQAPREAVDDAVHRPAVPGLQLHGVVGGLEHQHQELPAEAAHPRAHRCARGAPDGGGQELQGLVRPGHLLCLLLIGLIGLMGLFLLGAAPHPVPFRLLCALIIRAFSCGLSFVLRLMAFSRLLVHGCRICLLLAAQSSLCRPRHESLLSGRRGLVRLTMQQLFFL